MRILLVLLLFILAPLRSPIDTPKPAERETLAAEVKVEPGTARAWVLATSAILIERNSGRHDVLAGMTVDAKSVPIIKKMLEDDWDIKKSADLEQQLEWVATIGHRGDYMKRFQDMAKLNENELENRLKRIETSDDREVMRAIWKNAKRALKPKGGVSSWDYTRFVSLCRWGYAVGYLTEAAAWKHLDRIAKDIQKAYASWEDFGEGFCIARECFRPGDNADTLAAYEKLKTDKNSPWKLTPWNQKLVKLDKPEKLPEPKK